MSKITERRKNALERLQEQKKSGKKPVIIEKKVVLQDLTEQDLNRIDNEINTLKQRII
jgi:hypothetical protein